MTAFRTYHTIWVTDGEGEYTSSNRLCDWDSRVIWTIAEHRGAAVLSHCYPHNSIASFSTTIGNLHLELY